MSGFGFDSEAIKAAGNAEDMKTYAVEFTKTVYIEAEDGDAAVKKATKEVFGGNTDISNQFYSYLDGKGYN